MICLITGAAGFIGSHLCRRLLNEGFDVIGVDSFNGYYPKWIKEKNILPFLKDKKFKLIAQDLNNLDLENVLKKTDYVFHLAAQAGVRTSWGKAFSAYTKNNVDATQKILEAVKNSRIKKFIFASSSSVYGHCPEIPMSETSPLIPFSPYGVTKLAAEHLCFLYHNNFEAPTVSLRFFTVYGPGQRPDMAFHRFFKAIAEGKNISVYGNGKQTRDFTFIDDIIEASFVSIEKGKVGEAYNIGGGSRNELGNILQLIEKVCQRKIKIQWETRQKGDVLHTYANIDKAKKDLDYSPQTQLQDGLEKEWESIQKLYSS
ncbi:NAD-dependent epimerase/dehydratase family protein [Acidobacteriota bacterium]